MSARMKCLAAKVLRVVRKNADASTLKIAVIGDENRVLTAALQRDHFIVEIAGARCV